MRWISVCLAALLFVDIWSHQPHDGITFLAVGQGDCTLISKSDTHLLVDVGPRSDRFDAGDRLVWPELHRRGITHIDMVLLTHFDQDHIGGLAAVLRHLRVDFVVVVTPDGIRESQRAALTEAGVKPAQLRVLTGDQRFRYPGLEIVAFSGILKPDLNDNDQSPCLTVRMGSDVAVLTGDASQTAEAYWLTKGVPQAQIAKAGHHGSNNSLSQDWVDSLKPSFVVFSAGRNNIWHHPTLGAQSRATASGAYILRTDRDGSVEFRLDTAGRLKLLGPEDRSPLLQLFQR